MSARSETEIPDDGVPATAIVKSLPSRVDREGFLLQILLDVQRSDERPYEVNYVFPLSRMGPDLVLGMEVPIVVDPGDPRRIVIQWDGRGRRPADA
jgi:hypothetical protein